MCTNGNTGDGRLRTTLASDSGPGTYDGRLPGKHVGLPQGHGHRPAFRLFLHPALAPEPGKPSRSNECLASACVAGCNSGSPAPLRWHIHALRDDAEAEHQGRSTRRLLEDRTSLTSSMPPGAFEGRRALVRFTVLERRVSKGIGAWKLQHVGHTTRPEATISRVAAGRLARSSGGERADQSRRSWHSFTDRASQADRRRTTNVVCRCRSGWGGSTIGTGLASAAGSACS